MELRKYLIDLRERVTRMTWGGAGGPGTAPRVACRVLEVSDIRCEALRTWVGRAELDRSARFGAMTEDVQWVKDSALEV